MIETMRWFGPADPVSLSDIRQAGASGVVTSLHEVPEGRAWTVEEVQERQAAIEKKGLHWAVVESIPVAEEIKAGGPNVEAHIETWLESLRAVAAAGVGTVCYNFSIAVDWVRTDLEYELPNGAQALRFDATALAAFDLFILQRPGADKDYPPERISAATRYLEHMSSCDIERLTKTIAAGLPGSMIGPLGLERFKDKIVSCRDLTDEALLANLIAFQSAVVPEAEALGVKLALHPNDPPMRLFGLPLAASLPKDFDTMFRANPSRNNGLTWCLGSLSAGDPARALDIGRSHAERIHFAHLRVVEKDAQDPDSFQEAEHLGGDLLLVDALALLLGEERRRAEDGCPEPIPFRPDHGHRMADDLRRDVNPGYSLYGRMKGLAELRGALAGLQFAAKRGVHRGDIL